MSSPVASQAARYATTAWELHRVSMEGRNTTWSSGGRVVVTRSQPPAQGRGQRVYGWATPDMTEDVIYIFQVEDARDLPTDSAAHFRSYPTPTPDAYLAFCFNIFRDFNFIADAALAARRGSQGGMFAGANNSMGWAEVPGVRAGRGKIHRCGLSMPESFPHL